MNDEGALVGGGAVDEDGGIRAVDDDEDEGALVGGAVDDEGGIRTVDDDEEKDEEPLVVVAAALVDGGGDGDEDFEVEMLVTTLAVDTLEEMAVAAVTLVVCLVVDRLHRYSGQK